MAYAELQTRVEDEDGRGLISRAPYTRTRSRVKQTHTRRSGGQFVCAEMIISNESEVRMDCPSRRNTTEAPLPPLREDTDASSGKATGAAAFGRCRSGWGVARRVEGVRRQPTRLVSSPKAKEIRGSSSSGDSYREQQSAGRKQRRAAAAKAFATKRSGGGERATYARCGRCSREMEKKAESRGSVVRPPPPRSNEQRRDACRRRPGIPTAAWLMTRRGLLWPAGGCTQFHRKNPQRGGTLPGTRPTLAVISVSERQRAGCGACATPLPHAYIYPVRGGPSPRHGFPTWRTCVACLRRFTFLITVPDSRGHPANWYPHPGRPGLTMASRVSFAGVGWKEDSDKKGAISTTPAHGMPSVVNMAMAVRSDKLEASDIKRLN